MNSAAELCCVQRVQRLLIFGATPLRQRERERERQKGRDRKRETERETEKERETEREGERESLARKNIVMIHGMFDPILQKSARGRGVWCLSAFPDPLPFDSECQYR